MALLRLLPAAIHATTIAVDYGYAGRVPAGGVAMLCGLFQEFSVHRLRMFSSGSGTRHRAFPDGCEAVFSHCVRCHFSMAAGGSIRATRRPQGGREAKFQRAARLSGHVWPVALRTRRPSRSTGSFVFDAGADIPDKADPISPIECPAMRFHGGQAGGMPRSSTACRTRASRMHAQSTRRVRLPPRPRPVQLRCLPRQPDVAGGNRPT